jgi:hypothetical protein
MWLVQARSSVGWNDLIPPPPLNNFLRTALCLDKLTDFMRRMQTWFILLRNRVKHYLSSREALISYRRTGCSFNLANRFDTLPKCFVIFVVYTVRLYTVYVMIYWTQTQVISWVTFNSVDCKHAYSLGNHACEILLLSRGIILLDRLSYNVSVATQFARRRIFLPSSLRTNYSLLKFGFNLVNTYYILWCMYTVDY